MNDDMEGVKGKNRNYSKTEVLKFLVKVKTEQENPEVSLCPVLVPVSLCPVLGRVKC